MKAQSKKKKKLWKNGSIYTYSTMRGESSNHNTTYMICFFIS